jgi:hypothetical protein
MAIGRDVRRRSALDTVLARIDVTPRSSLVSDAFFCSLYPRCGLRQSSAMPPPVYAGHFRNFSKLPLGRACANAIPSARRILIRRRPVSRAATRSRDAVDDMRKPRPRTRASERPQSRLPVRRRHQRQLATMRVAAVRMPGRWSFRQPISLETCVLSDNGAQWRHVGCRSVDRRRRRRRTDI